MRIGHYGPLHDFQKSTLPPMPGASGQREVVTCRHCGLMGALTPDGMFVDLFGRNARMVGGCNHDTGHGDAWHAKIESYTLSNSYPELTYGSVHRLVWHPVKTAGFFVRVRDSVLELPMGSFIPVRVRLRRRRA